MIVLLFDSPVSVKDQARKRIIYFNVTSVFFFLFLAKRLGWRHWCRKTGQCIKSPSAMYVVEVLPLHQERKFLHYCWAARRRTFTKNLVFSAALLYLDTGGQCSHSSHTPSMASHSCTTCSYWWPCAELPVGFLVLCGLVLCLFCSVCVHLTSQLTQTGIGVTLGPLGIAVGWSREASGRSHVQGHVFPVSLWCQHAHAELDFECCTAVPINAAGPMPLYL